MCAVIICYVCLQLLTFQNAILSQDLSYGDNTWLYQKKFAFGMLIMYRKSGNFHLYKYVLILTRFAKTGHNSAYIEIHFITPSFLALKASF